MIFFQGMFIQTLKVIKKDYRESHIWCRQDVRRREIPSQGELIENPLVKHLISIMRLREWRIAMQLSAHGLPCCILFDIQVLSKHHMSFGGTVIIRTIQLLDNRRFPSTASSTVQCPAPKTPRLGNILCLQNSNILCLLVYFVCQELIIQDNIDVLHTGLLLVQIYSNGIFRL